MISHRHKCIFIHQRKTAGSSILASFGLTTQDPEWHAFNDGILSADPAWGEKLAAWNDYFVFSVVRNPWDRFVSGWKYCESTKHRPLIDVLENLPQAGHDFRHVTRLQTAILLDASGSIITNGLLRFESVQKDFDLVCDRIGKARCILPKANTTEHEHYSEYFKDPRALARFEQHFSKDIEYFDYRLQRYAD